MNLADNIFSELLKNRIILIDSEINDELAGIVTSQLLYLASKDTSPITIYINSPGGSVYAGFAIYDTIKYLSCQVNTVCTGAAMSMAAIIFLAGDKRLMLKHSRLMFHKPTILINEFIKNTELSIETKQLDELTSEINQIIHSVTSISELSPWDLWLNAEEALSCNAANEIL